MRYAIVIEKTETGWGAFVPDLPGCVAVAESEEEVRHLVREAIEFHLEGLREDGAATRHGAAPGSQPNSRRSREAHRG